MLGSDLDLDPWKILWIRQNDADPLDSNPQNSRRGEGGELGKDLDPNAD